MRTQIELWMIFILIVAEWRAMMYGARLQQLDFEILIFGLHYKHQKNFLDILL